MCSDPAYDSYITHFLPAESQRSNMSRALLASYAHARISRPGREEKSERRTFEQLSADASFWDDGGRDFYASENI